jgi:hypothetical protein
MDLGFGVRESVKGWTLVSGQSKTVFSEIARPKTLNSYMGLVAQFAFTFFEFFSFRGHLE